MMRLHVTIIKRALINLFEKQKEDNNENRGNFEHNINKLNKENGIYVLNFSFILNAHCTQ